MAFPSISMYTRVEDEPRKIPPCPPFRSDVCDWCETRFSYASELEEHKLRNDRSLVEMPGSSLGYPRSRPICLPKPGESIAAKAPLAYMTQQPASHEIITEERLDVFDELAEPFPEEEAAIEAGSETSDTHSRVVLHGMKVSEDKNEDREEDFGENSEDFGAVTGRQHTIPYSRYQETTDEFYSMSMPKSSFMANANPQNRSTHPLDSFRRGQFSIGSPKSFQTAQSSLASYATAPSFDDSRRRLNHDRYSSMMNIGTGSRSNKGGSDVDSSNLTEKISSKPVFGSAWFAHLYHRGILCYQEDELDWSGRGQHVEYSIQDADKIPLVPEKILGHGASAIVESVRCRRIRLARKTIKCDRRLRKEDAITEVEHLMRLQHSHIVRVVGTYTLKRSLAILLYPVTQWTLDEFMDEIADGTLDIVELGSALDLRSRWIFYGCILIKFLGCLSHAVNYIHGHNIKHMDIKPKNLLVRRRNLSDKIYIADFGIARAYASPEETITDSPISFTRTYAAPEVVAQGARGFSADVFSLGCVFMELIATAISSNISNQRHALLVARTSNPVDSSFSANIENVLSWYISKGRVTFRREYPWPYMSDDALDSLASMIALVPGDRPSMSEIAQQTAVLRCPACNSGPDEFEAADT